MRTPGRALLLLCLAAPLPAAQAQEATRRRVEAEQQAERIEWVAGAPPAAPAALGGPASAALGSRLPVEDLLVLQGGPTTDARIVIRVTAERQGRVERQVWDLRAERLVAFLARGVRAGSRRGQAVVPSAVWAEGRVRLVLEDSRRGMAAVEAAEGWLDVTREEAWLRQAELRARPQGDLGLPSALAGATPVLRAGWLRLHGVGRVVAEDAALTACDLDAPHYQLGARRIELRREEGQDPPPRGLVAGLMGPRGRAPGSDALRREATVPRDVRVEGSWVELLGVRAPAIPFLGWNTEWPFPRVRVGSSSRLGELAIVGLRYQLGSLEAPVVQRLDLQGDSQVEYYSERGTGGEQALLWSHRDERGRRVGRGHFTASAIDDRADFDRVGTPVPTEHRYWLRGLLQEDLPAGGQLDAEVSRLSDRGYLLEWQRSVAQTEKEQESYLHGRWSFDALSWRALARWRLNEFQTQVERLPELRLDWIHQPLWVLPPLGGLYLDLTARAGHLRYRPDDETGLESYRAGRGDVAGTLSWKTSLGPLEVRGWGTARESAWSGRAGDEEQGIERFLGEAGWNLATTLWRELDTPWSVVRHELVPEVGSRHRFAVGRDPDELLQFDPEVEQLYPTDHLFLRLRTRLLVDLEGRRRALADLSVESRWFPRDRGLDRAREWDVLRWDLRLAPAERVTARVRLQQDLNRGELLALDASFTVRPLDAFELSASWRQREGGERAVAWGALWRLTESWSVALEQQWDLRADEFLYHRARLVRAFHCFALEVAVSHDPQQDDTSASVSVALAPPSLEARDPFEQDRYRELYR